MRARPHRLLTPAVALAAAAVALTLPAMSLHGQTTSQPSAPAAAQPPACSAADRKAGTCTPAAPAPSARQQFPYPGSSTDPDDPIAPSTTAAPDNPPIAPKAGAGKRFPYPGETPPEDPAGASSNSSSSSSSSSTSADDPDDPLNPSPAAAPAPSGRRKLAKPTHLQSDDERFTEDVKVAKFYRDDGNNLAAYNRLRDATKLVTDDPDAWFLLGDVAEKLRKSDESTEAYRKFLALEPSSRRAKNLQHDQPQLRAAR